MDIKVFETTIEEASVSVQYIQMSNMLYIYVFDVNNKNMDTLSLSVETPYDEIPLSSSIVHHSAYNLELLHTMCASLCSLPPDPRQETEAASISIVQPEVEM